MMRSPHRPLDAPRHPGADAALATRGIDVADDHDVPVYVWPLNPWGGYPFTLRRS